MEATLDLILEREEESLDEMLLKFLVISQTEGEGSTDLVIQNGNHGDANEVVIQRKCKLTETGNDNAPEEELQVEELEAGLCIGSQAIFGISKREALIPKVDNFIEDDNDSDVSDLSSLSDLDRTDEFDSGRNSNQENGCVKEHQIIRTLEEKSPEIQSVLEENVDMLQTLKTGLGILEQTQDEDSPFKVVILNHVKDGDPLPGEVCDSYEEISNGTEPNITNLGLSLKMKPVSQNDGQLPIDEHQNPERNQKAETVSSDIISKFELDENFDYDNVELTPRFQPMQKQL